MDSSWAWSKPPRKKSGKAKSSPRNTSPGTPMRNVHPLFRFVIGPRNADLPVSPLTPFSNPRPGGKFRYEDCTILALAEAGSIVLPTYSGCTFPISGTIFRFRRSNTRGTIHLHLAGGNRSPRFCVASVEGNGASVLAASWGCDDPAPRSRESRNGGLVQERTTFRCRSLSNSLSERAGKEAP